MKYRIRFTFPLVLILLLVSCSSSKEEKQVQLYENYCGSCHLAPEIKSLPKNIWAENILPEMAARMGVRNNGYNPLKGLSFAEQEAVLKTGIYPPRPMLSEKDWALLNDYIIALAPDSLRVADNSYSKQLTQFDSKPIDLDSTAGSYITYLEYDTIFDHVRFGDISGQLKNYEVKRNKTIPVGSYPSPVIAHTQKGNMEYTTAIGKLDPSEIASGRIIVTNKDQKRFLETVLHRPVHMLIHDLDRDGIDELIVSEFGHHTGGLSLLVKQDSVKYHKQIVLNQPGVIKVVAKDMNRDGRDDLIVLTSQGDESITILYQEESLKFRAEKPIRFSPVYGSSWFELIDYDNDGDDDIITVNGDNADKSYVHKPYHGMRIHINNGNNNFAEEYFYAMNGATRLVADDFDDDGDIDFGVLSTFPDYENKPEFSFVYLENTNADAFKFTPYTLEEANLGRWLLMDKGDVDQDGDMDILLSSFTYSFIPVPAGLLQFWKESNTDMMILENKLIDTSAK